MFNPPHPGEILKEDVLEPLGLSVTAAALQLGISRKKLSDILNGKAAISPAIALEIEKKLASKAETWLAMQNAFDLWELRNG